MFSWPVESQSYSNSNCSVFRKGIKILETVDQNFKKLLHDVGKKNVNKKKKNGKSIFLLTHTVLYSLHKKKFTIMDFLNTNSERRGGLAHIYLRDL